MTHKKWKLYIPLMILAAVVLAWCVYAGSYYRAAPEAMEALESEGGVQVTETEWGWLFDGPSEEKAMVFYPGAKVDAPAYAPFLHALAAEGLDVCLVEMPFHFAIFGINKADRVIAELPYEHWYIGGHSLGGAMAAYYAADHGDQLDGIILCAAYPTKPLDRDLVEISLYGTEDGVLNMDQLEKGRTYAPAAFYDRAIEGGNHAQFGNYGLQKGDGTALISAAEQQRQAVEAIVEVVGD